MIINHTRREFGLVLRIIQEELSQFATMLWMKDSLLSEGVFCVFWLFNSLIIRNRADSSGNGPVVFSDDFGISWQYGNRTNPNLLSFEGFDVATYPLGLLVDANPSATLTETRDLLVQSSLSVTQSGNVDVVGGVLINNCTLRVQIDGRVATGTVQVMSSQNGGIAGEFKSVEVVVDGCATAAIGTAVYQQYSLSVAFQLQGNACEETLPRSAIIGISIGAVAGGIVFAVTIVLVIKALIASYTRDAAAKIKMKELQRPLLSPQLV